MKDTGFDDGVTAVELPTVRYGLSLTCWYASRICTLVHMHAVLPLRDAVALSVWH